MSAAWSAANWSESRFRKSIPKRYSLYSEASMFAAKDIAGIEEEGFELRKGQLFSMLTWHRVT